MISQFKSQMSINERCTKDKNILSRIQDIQGEEYAYLYKCIWWASVLCGFALQTIDFGFLSPTHKTSVCKSGLQCWQDYKSINLKNVS